MYKEIGNSVYGQVAMGLGGKKGFDIGSGGMVLIKGSFLTNPVLASYITGFTRAIIGECLYNIHQLGGRVISATTDGFITDIDDLENKMLNSQDCLTDCLHIYRGMREMLTTFGDNQVGVVNNQVEVVNNSALEVKQIENSEIIS